MGCGIADRPFIAGESPEKGPCVKHHEWCPSLAESAYLQLGANTAAQPAAHLPTKLHKRRRTPRNKNIRIAL
jgi:hypothetical protein